MSEHCTHDCDQGRQCPGRATRRVRAGRPPDNTGCLPVDYTADQLDAWRAEEAQRDWEADKRFARTALIVIVSVVFGLFCLGMWGIK